MPNNTPKKITAWYDRAGTNHPSQGLSCPTCNAAPGAPCTSTVGLARHGATGAPITGLHAARVDASIDHHSMCDHTECAVFGCVKGAA